MVIKQLKDNIKNYGILPNKIIEYFMISSNNNKEINDNYVNCIRDITKEQLDYEYNDVREKNNRYEFNNNNCENMHNNIAKKNFYDFVQPIIIVFTVVIGAVSVHKKDI